MKKLKLGIVLCALLASFHMHGCSAARFESLDTTTAAQEECKELLHCLSENDREGLKSMFCPIRVSEDGLDEQVQYAIEFFDGTVTGYDDIVELNDASSVREGKTTLLSANPHITGIQTDMGKTYEIIFNSYLINLEDESKVGISEIIILDESGGQCKAGKYVS